MLSLRGVSVFRGESRILHDMDWQIQPGESWAVLGANGSGKSTLAAALAGDAMFTGDIEYGWQNGSADPCARIASVSFHLHRLFVAQSHGYYQSRWYLGEEDATLTAGKVLKLTAGRSATANSRIQSTAKQLGIERLLKRQALHLSTGEMRRLLIARALLLSPILLVLDEPFIGLDAAGRNELARIVRRLMRNGQQIVFLSARPWEVPRQIGKRLWLKDGAVLGTTTHVNRSAKKMEQRAFHASRVSRSPIKARGTLRKSRVAREPVVELRGINLGARQHSILNNINWTVRAGERWAVMGPNGSGKTTLLSLLSGDHPQSYAQHVRLFGQRRGEGHTIWELKAKIGLASPDIALHYDNFTSVFDFICTGFFETLGLYRECSPAQQRSAKHWLDYFGLGHFAGRPFRALSDGQQRLALIARAMVKPHKLLILDEPCQGLDARARDAVLRAIDGVCGRGPTSLVIVTHYESELPRCVTHRLELQRGRQIAVQTVQPRGK